MLFLSTKMPTFQTPSNDRLGSCGSNLRQTSAPGDRGADRRHGAPWTFKTRCAGAGKFAVHERRHHGPAAEDGPGQRETGPSQTGDQHALAEEYCGADVWRLE